ncbi:MAG: apolipoprotein N-acyltransferase [Planctomycetota bacterium]|nr:apolipoprotein N-acyltransferase [Planctomycetota bacterium]
MPKALRESNRTSETPTSSQAAATHDRRARVGHAFWWALASGTLLWTAFPPLDWWPLAWVAPLGWLHLIRLPRLPGRRPYVGIWLASFLHWLALLQGVRLAHPALYLGWLALAAYVAVYPLVFVALTRVAVHRLRISILLSAPAIWTGLELVRGHALTGFSIALLGHTQIAWTTLLQIADLCGAYGVSFVVMGGAACLIRLWNPEVGQRTESESYPAPTLARRVSEGIRGVPRWRVGRMWLALAKPEDSQEPADRADAVDDHRRWTLWPLWPLAAGLAAVLSYGVYRQREADSAASREPAVRVALIQASFDTVFEANPRRAFETFFRYRQLSLDALERYGHLDLIVWPESTFSGSGSDVVITGEPKPSPDVPLSAEEIREYAAQFQDRTRQTLRILNSPQDGVRSPAKVHLLVGGDTLDFGAGEPQRFNSALLLDPTGEVADRYFKMHLVMFGEYIPFGRAFPWLYRLTPMPFGLTAGERPQVFQVAGIRISPSICFESTVPHLIRRQVAALEAADEGPEILINVTNDGWFWGSGILDLHLACAVFRAVENRRPMLVAANTGLSAHIDSNGTVLARGPRQAEQVILAEVHPGWRASWYQRVGDVPAGLCLAFGVFVAIVGLARRPLRSKAGERLE